MSFLKEFWEFINVRKKILVASNFVIFGYVWGIDNLE